MNKHSANGTEGEVRGEGNERPPSDFGRSRSKIPFFFQKALNFGSWASMVLQNYQNFIELTSNMIYIVAFGGGLKCPRKIRMVLH